jgi:hypothetical protein
MHRPDDPAARIDRAMLREHGRMTVGASAFHALDPAEMVMRLEEAAADPVARAKHERHALRQEVFSGFAEYLFAEGPHPHEVRRRIEGLFKSFIPELVPKIKGPVEWITERDVDAVLKKHARKLKAAREAATSSGSLCAWVRSLEGEVDFDFIRSMIVKLVEFLLSEGSSWRLVTSTAFCLAKALRPHLIASMSLEDIARLSGDMGGRATPSDRIKRLYTRRLEAAGAMGSFAHFQKSPSAVAKMSEAQKGNRNRRRSTKRATRHKRKPR